jgi:hypothetical protein
MMTLPDYLNGQLTDFVDSYKNYFRKTFGVALTFTLICFAIAAILFRFSEFDESVTAKQTSLLSYFFHRYSKGSFYSIIDLTKTVFLFFVSLYSLGLRRLSKKDSNTSELSFKHFFRSITSKDILLLVIIFVATCMLDFVLFKIESFSDMNLETKNAEIYVRETCFHLRIYLPLVFFALAIRWLTSAAKTKLTFQRILFLYISLWLYNEFAYEVSLWIRAHVFGLVLMPFQNPENYYLIESIIGIPLIAFYFLGYYSAMTTSLKLTELPEQNRMISST